MATVLAIQTDLYRYKGEMPALVDIRCEDILEVTIISELSDLLQGLRMSQGPDTVRSSTEALLYIYHRLGITNLKHDSSWCDEEPILLRRNLTALSTCGQRSAYQP
jgi:hypothetical protein